MSVPFSFPSVVVRGDLLTRVLPGGRDRLRDILRAHPAVRAIASDEYLDVAILKRGCTADAHELAAEVRRAVPRAIETDDLCGVCDRTTNLPSHAWLKLDWNRAKRRGIAWRSNSSRGRVARLCQAPAPGIAMNGVVKGTTLIELAEGAIRTFQWKNLSLQADSVYVDVTGPALITPLNIIAAADGQSLFLYAHLPARVTAATRDQTIAAMERATARFPWCTIVLSDEDEACCLRTVRLDPKTATVSDVLTQIHGLLRVANTIGLVLVKVVLGCADPEEIDAPIEALLAE